MPDIFDETKTLPDKPLPPKPVTQAQTVPQSLHILSAFTHNPQGISFANQSDDEDVILFLRGAFITNLSWISTAIILLILPLFAFVLLEAMHFNLLALPSQFPVLLLAFYYVLIIGYAFANFITWFYNIGIVTQKRVMDIRFSNITNINVAATALDSIKDTEYSQNNFSESFFDYGDVTLTIEDTPSRQFIFENVPHPARVVDIISKLMH